MTEEQKGPGKDGQEGSEALLSAWMKTANDFWGSMIKSWPGFSPSDEASPAAEKEDRTQVKMKEAMDSVPETVSKMSRLAFEAYSNLHQQWLDQMGRIGKSTEGSKGEDIHQDPLKPWMQMYEKEFRPFLTMPQLGLTRFYQERMAQAMDQFNLYQAAMGDFYNLLYRPMEKSNRELQEKLAPQTEEGNAPENFQEYYRLWVKTLEGHYMTLFKAPEFTQTLAETLKATENFMGARQAVLEDLLKFLPIPTHKDMEDLYQELYLLKKKVKELEMKLTDAPTKKEKPAKDKLLNDGENGRSSK
jgi:polyhydroxyalkanoate synthase subunit PhaE